MRKVRMDEKGRVLIPAKEREKLVLRSGTESELVEEDGVLLLKAVVSKPIRVRSKMERWGEESVLGFWRGRFRRVRLAKRERCLMLAFWQFS